MCFLQGRLIALRFSILHNLSFVAIVLFHSENNFIVHKREEQKYVTNNYFKVLNSVYIIKK